MGNEINLGTVYEFNKNAMVNEKPLDPIALNYKVIKLAEWMIKRMEDEEDNYSMLLCRERNDFTLFNLIAANDRMVVHKEIKETLLNRGKVVSVDETEDGVGYEIWIRDEANENFVYYLFPYTKGVIEINE